MKILHITDSHGAVKTPNGRTDDYEVAFLTKLAELKYVIEMNNIDMILHTGDLFHTSRVSNRLMGRVASILRKYNIPFYVVPGNHDIDGYTIATMEQTSLGLLANTGVVTILDRQHPIFIDAGNYTVAISGQEYYANIDEGNQKDFAMQQNPADFNILGIHGYIADVKQHPNIKCTYADAITTDADIILSGHYHNRFKIKTPSGVPIYNPGSMMRVEHSTYNESNMPAYGILELGVDTNDDLFYDYQMFSFMTAKQPALVFDIGAKNIAKTSRITLENFKTSISNTMKNIVVSNGKPEDVVSQVLSSYTTDPAKVTEYMNTMNAIFNTVKVNMQNDDIIAVKGYVPSATEIKIKGVIIKNFQSHTDTKLAFTDGCNLLLGSTDNGKTSILRAITWCLDNYPLGTDFITHKAKECTVRVIFSNDMYIERSRTRKDTGYYETGRIDENGNDTDVQRYQGFTNNVPVEVINIHQTPKVSITKNLETHLNMSMQLDRPFLITDSVNDKAIAIGKITGTDLIDGAIKEVGSNITANNKLLKQLGTDFSVVQKELLGYDINGLNASIKLFNEIKLKLTELNDKLTKLNEIKTRYSEAMTGIKSCESVINKANEMLSKSNNVAIVENKVLNLGRILAVMTRYNDYVGSIKVLQDKINKTDEVIQYKDLIDSTTTAIKKAKDISAMINSFNTISANITDTERCIAGYNEILSSENLVTDAASHLVLLTSFKNIKNKYSDVNDIISEYNDEIKVHNEQITKTEAKIEQLNQEITKIVLSNGICPCCGQSITEEHVHNIIQYGGM